MNRLRKLVVAGALAAGALGLGTATVAPVHADAPCASNWQATYAQRQSSQGWAYYHWGNANATVNVTAPYNTPYGYGQAVYMAANSRHFIHNWTIQGYGSWHAIYGNAGSRSTVLVYYVWGNQANTVVGTVTACVDP